MVSKEELSLNPLKEANKTLKIALAQERNEFVRDAVIQRFEYTFELSWKTLKRYFEAYNNINESNIKSIFREAANQGFISNVENWFEYLKARNLTSHTYNIEIAEKVYTIAKKFASELDELVDNLSKYLD